MNFCEDFEKRENGLIAPFDCPGTQFKESVRPEKTCFIRPVFQLGGFRIVYSNAFQHLKYRTLVFLSPLGDQYRTCLIHTLEVVQFATTITHAFYFQLRLCNDPVCDDEFPN
jgi:dGTPase